ncbi:hypothetical protein ADUPG1_002675, partial [Aduncisulcus paluster]
MKIQEKTETLELEKYNATSGSAISVDYNVTSDGAILIPLTELDEIEKTQIIVKMKEETTTQEAMPMLMMAPESEQMVNEDNNKSVDNSDNADVEDSHITNKVLEAKLEEKLVEVELALDKKTEKKEAKAAKMAEKQTAKEITKTEKKKAK